MLKASELVSFVKSMVGQPYWYGTCVYKCTNDQYARKKKQYPKHYTSDRTAKYKAHIAAKKVCCDCVGLIKGFFWTNGGLGVQAAIGSNSTFKNSYTSNGMPDKSADGLFSWCKSKGVKHGKISTLPEVAGVLLFSSGHVGVYIGGGYAIEARGFNYGVVKTRVANRGWKNWAYLPSTILDYSSGDVSDLTEEKVLTYTVKKGDSLWKIAKETMGKGSRYPEIVKLNGLSSLVIRVGQVLKIPE